MTWSKVLENILYFTNELLPSASKKDGWNKLALEQAVSWARYCEKVSNKARLDPVVLHKLQCALSSTSSGLTVSQLSKACELLYRSLLLNQKINPTVRLQVEQLMVEGMGEQEALLTHKKVEQQKEGYHQLLELLKSSQHELLAIKVKLRLFIEGPQQINSNELQEILIQVVKLPNGLLLLFSVLEVSCDRYCEENVLSCIINWLKCVLMSGKCDAYQNLVVQFCNIPKEVLWKGFHAHSSLLRPLLGAVRREARKLELIYCDVGITWNVKPGSTTLITYSDIVTLCSNLLADEILCHEARKSFTDWAMQEDGSIWLYICRKAKGQC